MNEHGVTLEWLDDRRIAYVTVTSTNKMTLDSFFLTIQQLIETWRDDDVVRLVYDLSAIHLVISPYLREQVTRVAATRPEKTGYVAIILRPSFVAKVGQIAMNALPHQARARHICFSRDEALAWLREG
jgi:hypothetical protein